MEYLTGLHAIEELIRAGRAEGPLLVAKAGPRARAIMDLAVAKRIPVNRTGTSELDRIAPDHRGIALKVDSARTGGESGQILSVTEYIAGLGERKNALVLVLDEITDPHNYGAILRSADQFGADLVITRKRRIARHAETITRTSAGASVWMPSVEAPNLNRALEELKEAGFWIYGADMGGEPVWDRDLRGRITLVMGGEGGGLSRLLRGACDGIVAIPAKGRIDSLNVSVAAGVLLYEVARQRGGTSAKK